LDRGGAGERAEGKGARVLPGAEQDSAPAARSRSPERAPRPSAVAIVAFLLVVAGGEVRGLERRRARARAKGNGRSPDSRAEKSQFGLCGLLHGLCGLSIWAGRNILFPTWAELNVLSLLGPG